MKQKFKYYWNLFTRGLLTVLAFPFVFLYDLIKKIVTCYPVKIIIQMILLLLLLPYLIAIDVIKNVYYIILEEIKRLEILRKLFDPRN